MTISALEIASILLSLLGTAVLVGEVARSIWFAEAISGLEDIRTLALLYRLDRREFATETLAQMPSVKSFAEARDFYSQITDKELGKFLESGSGDLIVESYHSMQSTFRDQVNPRFLSLRKKLLWTGFALIVVAALLQIYIVINS